MLEKLRVDVCKANLDLVAAGLVIQTWGNVSGIARDRGIMVIKPSGVHLTTPCAPNIWCWFLLAPVKFSGEIEAKF